MAAIFIALVGLFAGTCSIAYTFLAITVLIDEGDWSILTFLVWPAAGLGLAYACYRVLKRGNWSG